MSAQSNRGLKGLQMETKVWQKARQQLNQANVMRRLEGELREGNSRRIRRSSPFNGSPKRPGGYGSMAGREGKEASDKGKRKRKGS